LGGKTRRSFYQNNKEWLKWEIVVDSAEDGFISNSPYMGLLLWVGEPHPLFSKEEENPMERREEKLKTF